MPDVFISYSSSDEPFAKFLHRHLSDEGLSVFLASVSLNPGDKWSEEIFKSLKDATWVLFLCSHNACLSPYVQQELGGALLTQKKIIPIVWDMHPDNLPGWLGKFHALNLAGSTAAQIQERIGAIAERIKADKLKSQIIGGLLLAGLVFFASRS